MNDLRRITYHVVFVILTLWISIPALASPPLSTFKSNGVNYRVEDSPNTQDLAIPNSDLRLLGLQTRMQDGTDAPVSFIVLGKGEGKAFKPLQFVDGNSSYLKTDLFDLNGDGMPEILFRSQGGMHFTNLVVYEIQDGRLEPRDGFASNVDIKVTPAENGRPVVKVFREKFDVPGWTYADGSDRYEVWVVENGKLTAKELVEGKDH